MDYIRTPIIVALLIVSYILVLEWNKDFPNEPVQTVSTPSISEFDQPSQESPPDPSEAELATPEAMVSQNQSLALPSVTGSDESHSVSEIKIVTDLLSAKIDLNGGHISYTALNEYPVSLKNKAPLELFVRDQSRYFVAKSGLLGKNGFDSSKNGPIPRYVAQQSVYRMAEDQNSLVIDLKTVRDGVTVTKRYTFTRDSYVVDLQFIIENESDNDWSANFFAQFERNEMGDPTSASGFGAVSYLGAVLSTQEEPYEKISLSDIKDGPYKATDSQGWIGFLQHYFVTAWIPKVEEPHSYQLKERNGRYLMGYVDPKFTVIPGATETVGAKLYVGPKILKQLQEVAPNLDLTIDFGILWLIAKPLFLVMDFIHDYVGNWGIAIILLTVLIKAIFFHLSAASYRSMANMRRVTPELTRIRETYGDDRQKMSQAMMELYKKEKINPLGGCLPILVQMPVFIALYWVLLESVELRQAPFFLWIQDLSIKDPYFILPLAMGATMFLQMHLNPTPPDPLQAKVMKMMPVIFTIFFLWFPAGLVLYWLVNNCLSITQQWVITRKIEKEGLASK